MLTWGSCDGAWIPRGDIDILCLRYWLVLRVAPQARSIDHGVSLTGLYPKHARAMLFHLGILILLSGGTARSAPDCIMFLSYSPQVLLALMEICGFMDILDPLVSLEEYHFFDHDVRPSRAHVAGVQRVYGAVDILQLECA